MIKTDKLLVLKAFYLGYEIREQQNNKQKVSEILNTAINFYDDPDKDFSRSKLKRKLFYLLVDCELMRHENIVSELRTKAQEFAHLIKNIEIYLDYMKIVDATTIIHKSPDIVQMPEYTGRTSLQNSFSWRSEKDDGTFYHTGQTPFFTLGVNIENLSAKQKKFNKMSLIDVMRHHEIL